MNSNGLFFPWHLFLRLLLSSSLRGIIGEEMMATTDQRKFKSPGRVKFGDVAIYLSKEEWELMDSTQKRLYRQEMLENYKNVVSVGTPHKKPAMIVHLEQEEMAWSPALQRPRKKKKKKKKQKRCRHSLAFKRQWKIEGHGVL
ncbi:zinc finger protein 688-like [Gracilinanus agilis]|uniref:zinc finger protein 688-like n=1 Tax=Gracilinanus agilis TaxID=191870 RepID=UPI001CFE7794|nr:zinc finger protein 688-like [Gracilinanus agilis]